MAEVAAVAGQQKISLAVDRGQQDRLIVEVKPDACRQLEVARRVEQFQRKGQPFKAGQRRATVQGQVASRLLDGEGRAQELGIFKPPEPAQPGILQVCGRKQYVGVEKYPVQEKARRRCAERLSRAGKAQGIISKRPSRCGL